MGREPVLIDHVFQLFCPTSAAYNEDLPTKQNILCHRASINQILEKALEPLATSTTTLSPNVDISTKIRDPTSFTVGAGAPMFQPVTFHYQLPARKRFVVILERSSAMGLNNRWSLLHAELFRFITSLPNDVELALVTFGKTARNIIQ